MNLALNEDVVNQFLSALWPNQKEGFLGIAVPSGNGSMIPTFYQHPVKDHLLCGYLSRKIENNIYFSLGLRSKRPESGRGKEEDVTAIPALAVDIDCREGVHKETALPSRVEALDLLSELPLRASILIWTGGGFQAYWVFSLLLAFQEKSDRDKAKALSSAWTLHVMAKAKAYGWKIDNCSSLEHVFRLPGTWNLKGEPVPVEIVEINDLQYSPDDFKPYLGGSGKDDPNQTTGHSSKSIDDTLEIVQRCHFLRHCRDDAASLPEPSWWAMICALCFDAAREMIHELSETYPKYSREETDKKIAEAMKQSGPMTCAAIQEKTGFDCPSGGCGVKCPSHLHHHVFEWDDPVLLDEFPLPEMEPLPGIIGTFSKSVAAATETPLELAQGLALVAVATGCQRKMVVQVKPGYSEPLNIWVNVALESGNRKSAVHTEVTRPLLTWEAERKEEMAFELKKARSTRANQETRIKSLRAKYGKAEPDELVQIEREISALESELVEVPPEPKVWCQDVTPEQLGTLLGQHNESLSILSTEGGVFELIGGRYSNGIPNLDLWLQSHSGDFVRVDRGSRESVFLERPALSMGLSPQPDVLKSMASAPGFRGRGLLARFLYLLPASRLGHRVLETEPVDRGIGHEWRTLIYSVLDIKPKIEQGKPTPYVLHLEHEAYREWVEFSRVVEKGLREGGHFANITDWAGKLPGEAVRLAGLLHCVLHTPEPWAIPISLETMSKALGLASVFSSHALKVFNLMGCDHAMEGAAKVWRWVVRNRLNSFKKNDCYNALKGSYPKVSDIEPFLKVLEERNYIASMTEKRVGRPSVIFTVNSKLGGDW